MRKLKTKLAVASTALFVASNSVMAQAAIDPVAEATGAATTLTSVFGIIFAAVLGIAIGWKLISQIRRA